jgi:hypothetical protein
VCHERLPDLERDSIQHFLKISHFDLNQVMSVQAQIGYSISASSKADRVNLDLIFTPGGIRSRNTFLYGCLSI